jgi:biopolymer transport protein ExbD
MAHDATAPAITGINITPLVDIALVLLIVFMVTANLTLTQAIPMQVPHASNRAAAQSTLAVGIAANGALTLDGVPAADLPALVRRARERAGAVPGDAHAIIAASPSATHGAVIGAIDALRSAGVTKIAFAVEPRR